MRMAVMRPGGGSGWLSSAAAAAALASLVALSSLAVSAASDEAAVAEGVVTEREPAFESEEAGEAHEAYRRELKKAEEAYRRAVERARSTCVARLERAMEAATRRGNLEEAVRVRDAVERLRREAAETDEAREQWDAAALSRELEGTAWRRGDTGGTVTLEPGGRCSANNHGRGSWQATGPRQVEIEVESALHWPQRVRLRYRLVDGRTLQCLDADFRLTFEARRIEVPGER